MTSMINCGCIKTNSLLLQLLAVLPRARAIVQHRARDVQELQRPVQLLLVDAYLERDLGGLPLKVSE